MTVEPGPIMLSFVMIWVRWVGSGKSKACWLFKMQSDVEVSPPARGNDFKPGLVGTRAIPIEIQEGEEWGLIPEI